MEEETTQSESALAGYFRENSEQISEQLGQYSYLVADSLGLIALGMLAVYILHRLVNRFLMAWVDNKRLLMVTFGTLYILVLVFTVIIVLNRMGFDVSTGGPIAIIMVLFAAMLLYFVIPFLPSLPFIPGHMIETGGVLGTVDKISSFHTTIRKFDGTLVFLPNALVMAKPIANFTYLPNRRIELKVSVAPESDLEVAKAAILATANTNHRVLGDPAPALYAVEADASGINFMLYCWVENADFLPVRSELWLELIRQAREDGPIRLSLPKQEVVLQGEAGQ